MSNTAKNLIIVLALITVAYAGYFIFQRVSNTPQFDANAETLRNMEANSQLFIKRSAELQSIDLDLSFFSDDRLKSLESFDTPLVEPDLGRENPFTDLGQGGV